MSTSCVRRRPTGAAVLAVAAVRVRSRASLLPCAGEQLRQPDRANGLGAGRRGRAARRDAVRGRRRRAARRHAGVVRRRAACRLARASAGHVLVHRNTIEQGLLTPDRHADTQAELAADQLDAVLHDAGPARVIAPAGSGKTRVLTERFRLLVARNWAPARSPPSPTTCAPRTRCATGSPTCARRAQPHPHAALARQRHPAARRTATPR